MTKAKRMAEIRQEISWYKPQRRVRETLLKLGDWGFMFSGHGVGFGGEDFSMIYTSVGTGEYLYVGVTDHGNGKIRYSASHDDKNYNRIDHLKPVKNRRTLFAWIQRKFQYI